MALTDEGGNGFYMPVAPAYQGGYGNNNGFGGDWAWILLLLLIGGGNWGMGGFGGGFGNMMLGYDFPWLLTGQQNINSNTNNGFRDAMLNDGITSIRDGISGLSTQLCGCCGDISTQLCNGFAGVNAGIANGFAQSEIAANARQMADMQTAFAAQNAMNQGFNGIQSQIAQCCCDNRLATAQTQALVQSENCADRYEASQNTQAIISAITGGIQAIKDDLCADRLDAERRENANLRSELMYARGQASQIEQTAQIRAGQNATMNSLVNELRSCPIPSQPVYGSQPIFTCQNNGCGCNCGCGA